MSEVESIKDALSIYDVVSRHVELKKAGINYQGLCPFHNEKTPSFYVSPDRGTYKCFGCGEGGDIYSFVEKLEGLTFREVLEKFSIETGIPLSKTGPSSKNTRSRKDTQYAILDWARIFWQKQLTTNPAAIEYLKKRGFTKQQVVEYALGYAPSSWDSLKNFLLEKGVAEKDIEEVGLIKTGDKGSTYDRFRDRIIFPLRNQAGKTVAFSGRYIGTDDVSAKYLNSPETPVFNKSKELYGLDTARDAIRKNNFVIVVEGQVDLVMGQSVYKNTVATSGTSLTRQHVESLKRFTDRIIFVFDSDNAGINAAHKASLVALDLDFEVRIAMLPTGKDPADIITEDVSVYKRYIKEAKDVYDYWIATINRGGIDPREKTKIIEERLVPLLTGHGNPLEQDRYTKHVAHALDVSEDSLRSRMMQMAQNAPKNPTMQTMEKPTQTTPESNNPLDRLVLIYLWQQSLEPNSRFVDLEKDIVARLDSEVIENFQENIKAKATEEHERDFFEFEKMYQNSIMLGNDVSELITNLSLYRNKQRQMELTRKHKIALQEGNSEEAQRLLQEIHNIVSTHG